MPKEFIKIIVQLIEQLMGKTPSKQPTPEVVVLPEAPKPEAPKPEVPKPEAPKPEAPKVVVPESGVSLNFVCSNVAKLSEADYIYAAKMLDVEIACVKAVTEVESSGGGYLPSKRPKILFESHLFSKQTSKKFDASYPHISFPKWNKTLYKGGEGEYPRLLEAMSLDRVAALKSASYGLFQILGLNYKSCGFNDVESFVKAQVESESKQLESFINFLKSNGLDIKLRNKDFTAFARQYNGPGYEANGYHLKLEAAYNKHKGA